VDGADPQLSDDTRGLLWDLVMHGAGIDVPESVAPGDAAQPPGPQVPQVRGCLDCTCWGVTSLRFKHIIAL
jgi:hypothetical protein